MALRGKMQAYAEARAQGLSPADAAAHADYSGSASRVTVSRIEARADVQAEIGRLKHGGVDKGEGGESGGWQMKDRYASPLDLLEDVWNNPQAPKSLRYQAAKDALPYCHPRKDAGKKEDKEKAAKEAAKGKFKTARRPGQSAYAH
jgi:hypothetical protein